MFFFRYLARVICTWQDKIDKFVHIIYVFNYFDKMIYHNCKEIFIIRNNHQSTFFIFDNNNKNITTHL